ncbi:MAG: hypothetical protein JW738_10505 [Actinobacteria bacterium]|nr:hypothetical protein [Actinomycetota bacterium]
MPVIHQARFGRVSVVMAVIVLTGVLTVVCSRPVNADPVDLFESLWADLSGKRCGEAAVNSDDVSPAPTVTGITFDSAVNAGTARITDPTGTGFRDGARVFLVGQTGMITADSGATVI